MAKPTMMRRGRRLVSAMVLACLAGGLTGCGSLNMPSWDPTDLMDFLDTKKRAPGERKPVFPEGVPGISQGVPKELVRGSPEQRAASEPQAAAAPVEPPPPAKRATKSAQKSAARRPPPQEAPVEIAPDDVNVEEEAPPPPPPRRQAQRSQRAPQQQAEPSSQSNPFPAPLPR